MNAVFEVGDRVKLLRGTVDNERLTVGACGTVVHIHTLRPSIGVRWDEIVLGGHTCSGCCENGYGWYVWGDEISKIPDEDELLFDEEFEWILKEVESLLSGGSDSGI